MANPSFSTAEDYISHQSEDRKDVLTRLRQTVLANLPEGFEEGINYGMIGYYVPHSLYPDGYHCDPKLPLPFINIASQKGHIGFYHMGLYADPELMKWWVENYPKHATRKLDMGKSCVRFKRMDDIPYELIGELISKVSPQDWISTYERNFKKK